MCTLSLARGERGVWRAAAEGNLDGVYYDYTVTDAEGVARRTADPWAVACGRDGARSMVIDLRRTDPENWAADAAPARGAEDIIYETHVKDFSFDPGQRRARGVPRQIQSLYAGAHHAARRRRAPRTCVAYLRRLGVTHVQLMPVFDYGSVPEGSDAYNWGYDPVNYNVPDGSYATDADDGAVRIRELKEAVQALHQNGLRVIMDVVYNHTYTLDSWLWRTEPWYFYRQNADGTPSDGSGCGNDLASERSMCARYIRESVLYWAREYHFDGFRFDLMGLLDTALMQSIRAALDAEYGKGENSYLASRGPPGPVPRAAAPTWPPSVRCPVWARASARSATRRATLPKGTSCTPSAPALSTAARRASTIWPPPSPAGPGGRAGGSR